MSAPDAHELADAIFERLLGMDPADGNALIAVLASVISHEPDKQTQRAMLREARTALTAMVEEWQGEPPISH